MIKTIEVNESLVLQVVTGHDPHVDVDRHGGGLVRVEPCEVRHLVAALTQAAGLLAEQEAQRARSSRAIEEARRLRRRRMGDNDG